jgi:hypothetical protein
VDRVETVVHALVVVEVVGLAVVETLIRSIATLHSAHFSGVERSLAAQGVVSELLLGASFGIVGLASFFFVLDTDFLFDVEFLKSLVG